MIYAEFLEKIDAANKPRAKRSGVTLGVTGVDECWCFQVLEGDNAALIDAFNWSSTPQGSAYWDARYEGEILTEEDLDFISGLVS